MQRATIVLRVVPVKILRLVIQRIKEDISGSCALTRAAQVGLLSCPCSGTRGAIRVEALCPIVPTAGLRSVNQREGWRNAVRGKSFLVEVDGYVRNKRFPRLQYHLRSIIKGTRRGVCDLSLDTTVLAHQHAPASDKGIGHSRAVGVVGWVIARSRIASGVRCFSELDPGTLVE